MIRENTANIVSQTYIIIFLTSNLVIYTGRTFVRVTQA